jgi:hypothetical protein
MTDIQQFSPFQCCLLARVNALRVRGLRYLSTRSRSKDFHQWDGYVLSALGRIQNDLVKVAVSLLPALLVKFERYVTRLPIGFPRRATTLNLSKLAGRAAISDRNAVSGEDRVAEKSDPDSRTDPNMHSLGLENLYSSSKPRGRVLSPIKIPFRSGVVRAVKLVLSISP